MEFGLGGGIDLSIIEFLVKLLWPEETLGDLFIFICVGQNNQSFLGPTSPDISWVVVSNILYVHPYVGKIPN